LVFEGGQYQTVFANGTHAPNPFVNGNPTLLAYPQAQCAKKQQRLKGTHMADPDYLGGNPLLGPALSQVKVGDADHLIGEDGHQLLGSALSQLNGGDADHLIGEEAMARESESASSGECGGNTDLFRLSADLSKRIADGGNTTGSCSTTYLYAPEEDGRPLLQHPVLQLPGAHQELLLLVWLDPLEGAAIL